MLVSPTLETIRETLCLDYANSVEWSSEDEHPDVLRTGEDFYKLDWPAQDPRRVRYAVATDAIALVEDPSRLKRVSRCPGRGCGWLFLNTSGRRRWCSMSTCGSREKMRRLHHRQI